MSRDGFQQAAIFFGMAFIGILTSDLRERKSGTESFFFIAVRRNLTHVLQSRLTISIAVSELSEFWEFLPYPACSERVEILLISQTK